jgi:hypothetical protein
VNSDPPLPSSPVPPRRGSRWFIGILVGDIAIGLLFGLIAWMQAKVNFLGSVVGGPSFFLVPPLGGLIASYIWRHLKPTIGATALNTLWMTLLGLVVAAIFFSEGVICLLILSPIFYAMIFVGALLGRIWFKVDANKLFVSIFPLLAVIALGEPFARIDQESVLTDEIIIRAPAAKVWREVKSFPEIPSEPRFWLFRMGLPYPMSTTSAGDFVNAERQCIFSDKAIFEERVVELVPREKLTFEILESPKDPELIGHLTPHRGQFVLRSNADGTTTLVGSTWYTLHVRPVWYFDLWTQHIFRAVHLRVMEDIRRRAELSQ